LGGGARHARRSARGRRARRPRGPGNAGPAKDETNATLGALAAGRVRGALRVRPEARDPGAARAMVTASTGNQGQGVGDAARLLGWQPRVVAPTGAAIGPRHLGWVLPGLWLLVLLVPSVNAHRFDGLPLSSVPEAGLLALLLPFLVSPTHRRALRRWLGRRPPALRRGLVAGALLALGLKLVLLGAGAPVGFTGCYRSTLTPPPGGPCERSFENPFFRFGATRVDRRLDFGPGDWDLSFFNSNRFNFYPWVPGNPRRDRLPFAVTWRGVVHRDRDTVVVVRYAGEGAIGVGGSRRVALPPSYEAVRTVAIPVPAGRHDLEVAYTFDDGSRTQDRRPVGPYATIRLWRAGPDGRPRAPLEAVRPRGSLRALGGLVDALLIGLGATLVTAHAWWLRREWPTVGAAAAVVTAIAVAGPRATPLRPDLAGTLVAWALLGFALARARTARLTLAYFALLGVAMSLTALSHPRLGAVVYRSAGDDWLTYESLARSILETGSLQGGEAVFFNQPLFRYVRFAQRLLLGDGDGLLAILAWTALHWSWLWAATTLWRRGGRRTGAVALFVPAAGLLLALAGCPTVVAMANASLSEHVTWILLPLGFTLLAGRRTVRRWSVGGALLGAAVITRLNQAPGVATMAAALLGPALRRRTAAAVAAAAAFVAVCLLPLAHNRYYGGRLVLATTSATHPYALGVPTEVLLRIVHDPDARARLAHQVRALLFLPPWSVQRELRESLVLHGLQAAWLAAIWLAWRRRSRGASAALLAVPALYLVVHVVYDVGNYYPRHILAGHFAMGLVAMAVAAQVGEPAPRPSPGCPPPQRAALRQT
jgi:hypothetical protein